MSHRTQITLTDEQYARLRDESKRTGVGLAELVRRALDRAYGAGRPESASHAIEATFGGWADRDVGGAEYVESLRRGMAARLASE